MVWYKIKKLIREKGWEVLKMSTTLSFIAASAFLILVPAIFSDDVGRRERIQMIITFIISATISSIGLLYFDTMSINILLKVLFGSMCSFVVFFPVIIILMTIKEYKDIKLNKSEERDAKLSNVLNKFRI